MKKIDDKNDGSAANKRFKPIAAIKMFAFVFSKRYAKKVSINVHKIKVKMNPTTTDFVAMESAKKENAENEIIPSKKSASRPAYSLKSAPVAAKSKGVEYEKIFKTVDKKLLIF